MTQSNDNQPIETLTRRELEALHPLARAAALKMATARVGKLGLLLMRPRVAGLAVSHKMLSRALRILDRIYRKLEVAGWELRSPRGAEYGTIATRDAISVAIMMREQVTFSALHGRWLDRVEEAGEAEAGPPPPKLAPYGRLGVAVDLPNAPFGLGKWTIHEAYTLVGGPPDRLIAEVIAKVEELAIQEQERRGRAGR